MNPTIALTQQALERKRCSRCRESKYLSAFHKDVYARDGKSNVCAECAHEISTNYGRTGSVVLPPRPRPRSGTYSPSSEACAGDGDLAMFAARVWLSLGLTYETGPREGVTVTERWVGRIQVRLIARDLFNGFLFTAEVDPDTGKPFDPEILL